MPTPKVAAAPHLEESLATLRSLTDAIGEAADYALRAEPGGSLRDGQVIDALANVEQLVSLLDDLRSGFEALP